MGGQDGVFAGKMRVSYGVWVVPKGCWLGAEEEKERTAKAILAGSGKA